MKVSTKHFIAIALLAFGTSLSAFGQTYMEQAKQKILANQYQEGINILLANRAGAERSGKTAAIDNTIGWSYYSLGQIIQAESYLTRALAAAEKENNAELKTLVANNLGVLYFVRGDKGDLDKSLANFDRPYNRDTKLASDYRKLILQKKKEVEIEKNVQIGLLLRGEQKFDVAVQSYNNALAIAGDDPRLLELKGYSLYRLGKYDEATRTLETALKADAANSRPLVALNLIKCYCAENKEDSISALIKRNNMAASTLSKWWAKDREFQTGCQNSSTIKRIVGA
jgi:tetratricopeptide (TPR) repeat protein